MRPDDITIDQIAKKHADLYCTASLEEKLSDRIATALVEALDCLDEADLASRLTRAERDQEAWFQKYLLEIAKVKDLEARMSDAMKILEEFKAISAADVAGLREDLVDLRYACEGFKALATKLEMERTTVSTSTSGTLTATRPE